MNGTGNKRKRALDDELEDHQGQTKKRDKVDKQSKDEEVLVLDDPSNGVILIDDD